MNHRPIVLPGVATGAVLLAALVGFVHLPEDSAQAASGSSAQADISMCRSISANAATVDLDTALKGTDATTVYTALNTVLGGLQETVTDPTVSKTVQRPVAEFFAVGVRTFNAIGNTQQVTAAQVADLATAYDAVTATCAVADA